MKLKKISIAVLAVMLVFVLVACAGDYTNGNDDVNENEYAHNDAVQNDADMPEFSPVFVNGENVAGARVLRDEDYFPTHVELAPVAVALGIEMTWDEETGEVVVQMVSDKDIEITLVAGEGYDSILAEGVLYLPVLFFRNELGVTNVFVSGGEVHMSTHADDMA